MLRKPLRRSTPLAAFVAILTITAIAPAYGRPARLPKQPPVVQPTPEPSVSEDPLGLPVLVDTAGQILGSARIVSATTSRVVIATGEIDGRAVPFTATARVGGFQATGLLYHQSSDCTGPGFLQPPLPASNFSEVLVGTAAVLSPNVDQVVASGPGTTAYVASGDARERRFKSHASAIDLKNDFCSGFVIAPATCCQPTNTRKVGVPAIAVDLGGYVAPFRLEMLATEFLEP